jgi:acetate kinase
MRLLIDADPPCARWCAWEGQALRTGRSAFHQGWLRGLSRGLGPRGEVTSVSYRLRHGGDRILVPAQRVTRESVGMLREVRRFEPEHNELTYEVLRELLAALPDVPHFVLCDTAFFLALPEPASAYAVPAELRNRGVRRYGGSGLVHEWVWRGVHERFGSAVSRVVSIMLGDHPNVAALKDGLPVETTMGFTPVEGIPSHTGCGDVDVSVVFELRASGMPLREINEMLSVRSGFRALVGRKCGFRDLVAPGFDAKREWTRRILRYGLVKSVGACAAVLGGVDAVVFAAEDLSGCTGFILEICRDLASLGLRIRPSGPSGDDGVFSEDGSGVKVLNVEARLWDVMAARAAALEKEE